MIQTVLTVANEHNHLYSLDRKPTDYELSNLSDLIALRKRAMRPDVLGAAGEFFIRSFDAN